jgi:hypothetical protein
MALVASPESSEKQRERMLTYEAHPFIEKMSMRDYVVFLFEHAGKSWTGTHVRNCGKG